MPSSPRPPSSPTVVVDPVPTTSPPVVDPGFAVTNAQTLDASGIVSTHITFVTTDPSSDVQITEDLSGNAAIYYDDSFDPSNNALLSDIQFYASKITCSDFHGKGTIDDYTELFMAASKIANESKQMQLDVDIDGFNEFASAADEMSKLFTGFILKLQNVSIINDTAFLKAVSVALKKIWNLSEVFGRFKETILATSSVQLPKSAHDTRVAVETVMGQVNCAMKYITHFVDSSAPAPVDADLSSEEKSIISNAVTTIENWNVLCEQGVSIAMSTNPDIVYMTNASSALKQNTAVLSGATDALKLKLAALLR